MVTRVTELVPVGLDNEFKVVLSDNDGAVDFTATTRMTLTADGVTIDSDQEPDAFQWNELGEVTMKLGSMAVSKGFHEATLIQYDPNHSSGQLLCSPEYAARLSLKFI